MVVESHDSNMSRTSDTLSPLPRGEGQGEGQTGTEAESKASEANPTPLAESSPAHRVPTDKIDKIGELADFPKPNPAVPTTYNNQNRRPPIFPKRTIG